ncbi:MAG TPA: Asp-tRNA(Asn)/Glu-tRNA(Gln) amidotransferase subunit GatB [Candidatus Saccharimonadales bacterium]|nr:Asp-tRNA(Asn)/Glu-tRNA(Gln) amidotransferase subunit GatB [Candidatus Saccharimonadales bacterium]
MANPKKFKTYQPTIGIECHVQLKTKTKLFAAVGNDAREAPPNTLISYICLGMPGALPVLNREAIHLASRAALALNTKPQHFSKFDRKHYFYPDLPKGYQITQYDQPIIVGGKVETFVDGKPKIVRITRAHLEEDAGKSTHPAGKDYSLVDLNRAGTPLLEIVSEPDMHSAAEAKAYVKELYLLMRYADVSYANLYYGNMRFDVNVSISPNDKLGTRTETKNLNSFRSVEKAVEYEIKRQTELLEKGEKIVQETRGWDEAKQKTVSQRSKEDAHDYRYMPEPDVPPIVLDDDYLKNIEKDIPTMPNDYRTLFRKAGIDNTTTEILLLSPDKSLRIKTIIDSYGVDHAKRIANLAVNSFDKLIQGRAELTPFKASVKQAIKLSEMLASNQLSSTAGKEIWIRMNLSLKNPDKIAEELNLIQVSDIDEITEIVKRVIADNPKAAEDVLNGEMKAIGFLVGQVMQQSQGKANPQLAQELIRKHLKS